MKVPAIKIDNQTWKEIKPILEGFGCETDLVDETIKDPFNYLVINCNDEIGNCNNFDKDLLDRKNRYLVEDKEEFLEKAAELMDKKYIKKNVEGMKFPCIEISKEDWGYMKPILEEFGYKTGRIDEFSKRSLLVLNVDGNFGDCDILFDPEYTNTLNRYNRYFVNDREEFLEKAKELMDEICGKKKFTLKDIKPGMVVELRNHDRMLAILVEGKLRFIDKEGSFNIYHDENFSELEGLTDLDIIKVFEPISGSTLLSLFEDSYLKLIWERPKEKRVVSKQEIRVAFQIRPDEELEIVD